jgi:hypothetical protein
MAITQEAHVKDIKLKASEVEGSNRWAGREREESVQDVRKPIDFCALDGI